MSDATNLERNGFTIVRGVLDREAVGELIALLEPIITASPSAGVRGLAQKVPRIRALSESPAIKRLVEPVLGPQAKMIRSVLFNKDQETNWQVAWHQDLSIAVKDKIETDGFSSWSLKDGLVHVQPPVGVLENMLTLRLHLDAANESNGALWVLPGSHRFGRVPAGDAAALAKRNSKTLCAAGPGDALLLRPLVLHASRKAVSSNPRRVIHLEFSGAALPEPLVWNEAA